MTASTDPPGDPSLDVEEPPPLAAGDGDKKVCCSWCGLYSGVPEAKGYAWNTSARGAIIMSNIFLSVAFVRLASEAAGCTVEADGTLLPCDERIYGFKPSSLITNIATLAGIISAFCIPIIGAIIDFTPHRRLVGIASATLLTAVQAIQIGTGARTWFPMAVLQAINSFLYLVQAMATYAYLPTVSISKGVSEQRMTKFNTSFTMIQFGCQLLYVLLIAALQIGLGLGEIRTAVLSQAVNVGWITVGFVLGWRLMGPVPALHDRPGQGTCLLVSLGFGQIWKTAVEINRTYGTSLRWFFLSLCFAEAAANAFTVVAVTFMADQLEMSGTQISIVFVVVLLSTLPGSVVGYWITLRTDPILAWKLNFAAFSISVIAGGLILTGPQRQDIVYAFGVVWGLLLGWYYPCVQTIFSLAIPIGQESELAGFVVYCRTILVWLPPLTFTALSESGIGMEYALMSLAIFFAVALGLLQLMVPWEETLALVAGGRKLRLYDAESEHIAPTPRQEDDPI